MKVSGSQRPADTTPADGESSGADRLFRVLIESVTDLIAILLPDGSIGYVSPSHETVLGYRPDELIGRNAFDLVHPEDRPALSEKFLRGIATAQPTETGEFRYACKDGGWRTVEGIGRNLLDDPTIRGIVVVSRDVSERKQRELEQRVELENRVAERTNEIAAVNERLRVSEQRYRELVETVRDVVYVVDLDGRFTYVNSAVQDLTGHVPAELIGRPFLDIIPPDDHTEVMAVFRRGLIDPIGAVEHRIVTKNGTIGWVRSLARRVERADGHIELRGVASDVTDRRNAEERTRQQQAELAHVQRMATMGQMAAELAHEINQPLGAIVNYADGLAVRLQGEDHGSIELHDIAKRVAEEARRAAAVLRRVRDFVGTRKPSLESCDVNELVGRTVELIGNEVRSGQVTLRWTPGSDIPPLQVDRVQIQQVLLNLLRNAVEAVAAGGSERRLVEVETAFRDVSPDARLRVLVRDSGIGLPGDGERIFDAFFTTKRGGLGMGLAISRSIAEVHGGRLWAESNPSGGALFHLELPLQPISEIG